jgi:hypothetical protein
MVWLYTTLAQVSSAKHPVDGQNTPMFYRKAIFIYPCSSLVLWTIMIRANQTYSTQYTCPPLRSLQWQNLLHEIRACNTSFGDGVVADRWICPRQNLEGYEGN